MLHFLFTLFGFLIITALIVLRRRKSNGKRIPGPTGVPVFGCLFNVNAEDTHEKFSDFARIFGEICQVKLFNSNVVLLNTEELIRATSAEGNKQYLNDRSETFYGEKILFGSQSTAFYKYGYSAVHNNLRKGFARAVYLFGPEHCASFERNILEEIENDLVKEIELHNGEEFEFTSKIQQSLTKMLAFALSGEIYNCDVSDLHAFVDYTDMVNILVSPDTNNILTSFPFLHKIPGPYASHFEAILKAKANIVKRFYEKQKDSYTPGVTRGFVDYYIEQQREDIEKGGEIFFTDERIICQILELSASVMLTTFGTIVNTLLCLVNHPIYQDKMFEELDRIVGRGNDLKYSDKKYCPMFEAVEMEVHRYLTGFPLLLPRTNTTHLEFGGYDLPKGSILIGNIWFIHHDEKVWGDPWNFRPERWLDDQGNILSNDHVYRKNWLPFGSGRRKCVGEQFTRSRYFMYMATLLRRWKFIASPGKCGSCDPRNHTQFDIKVTIRTKPFYCKAEERYQL